MRTLVVLITGVNNGIGYHLAKSLLEDGYRVAGIDLSGDNIVGLKESNPGLFRFYSCDVTNSIQANNACRAIFAPFEARTPEEARSEFDVNYFGYFHMISAVLPHMKAQRIGIIHNVSSSVGVTGFPGLLGYASSKGAIEALTRTLAIEFEPHGIKVNMVHPPLTNTKSAAPLGVPPEILEDPARVGRKLATKIQSTAPIITSDCKTALGLFVGRHFPVAMGRLMAR